MKFDLPEKAFREMKDEICDVIYWRAEPALRRATCRKLADEAVALVEKYLKGRVISEAETTAR